MFVCFFPFSQDCFLVVFNCTIWMLREEKGVKTSKLHMNRPLYKVSKIKKDCQKVQHINSPSDPRLVYVEFWMQKVSESIVTVLGWKPSSQNVFPCSVFQLKDLALCYTVIH